MAPATAKTAPRRSLKARGDVFLVFKAGFAQVHVGIGAAGHQHEALRVKNLAAVVAVVASGGHGNYFAVPHQQVNGGIKVACCPTARDVR